jgi:hypothetical protein
MLHRAAVCRVRCQPLQTAHPHDLPLSTAADYSLVLLRSYFCTLSNITIDTNYNRGAEAGHIEVALKC